MDNNLESGASEYMTQSIDEFMAENPTCLDDVFAGDAPDSQQRLWPESSSQSQAEYNYVPITPFVPHIMAESTSERATNLNSFSPGTASAFITTAPSKSSLASVGATTPGSDAISNQSQALKSLTSTLKAKKTPAPKMARAKCTQCKKSFQPPKKPPSQPCSKCRKKAIEDGNSSAGTPAVAQDATTTIQIPDDFAAAISFKTFDSMLKSSKAATNQLLNKSVLIIKTPTDDYASLDQDSILRSSKQMFDALLAPPLQPPVTWDDAKKAKYREAQLEALARCINGMSTDEDQSDASARCRLAVDDAIKLHENGLRVNELTREARESVVNGVSVNKKGHPRRLTTRTSFLLDVGISCSERIAKIIEAARINKLVAEEILDGRKVLDLVRCPSSFLDRKMTNFATNRGKHTDEKAGGDLRREKQRQEKEAAAASMMELSQARAGEKRMAPGSLWRRTG